MGNSKYDPKYCVVCDAYWRTEIFKSHDCEDLVSIVRGTDDFLFRLKIMYFDNETEQTIYYVASSISVARGFGLAMMGSRTHWELISCEVVSDETIDDDNTDDDDYQW